MEKQSIDHIETKIAEAAKKISPAYKEEAWSNMEALLDKKSKEERSGIIILIGPLLMLLLFLLLIVPAIFYYKKGEKPVSIKNTVSIKKEQSAIRNNNGGVKAGIETKRTEASASNSVVLTKKETYLKEKALVRSSIKNGNKTEQTNRKNRQSIQIPLLLNSIENDLVANTTDKNTYFKSKIVQKETGTKDVLQINEMPELTKPDTAGKQIAITKPDTTTVNNDSAAKTKAKTDRNNKGETLSRWYFAAVVAADANGVQKIDLNNTTALYGFTIGYHLNKRLSVQTGFFAVRKKYIIRPQDYKFDDPNININNIGRIDANCYMLDVPVSLRYDVVRKNKFNVFAVAGLSSVNLASEKYEYDYTANGILQHGTWDYSGNKNLFSMLNLSVGYEQKISEKFSLQVAPYIKIPLAGIGDGEVKLRSAGIEVGLKYQPLHKKDQAKEIFKK